MPTVTTFTAIIGTMLPEPHAGLLAGMLFGTKSTLSRELVTSLTATGTLHIIALSGMNISILAALSMTTFLRFVSRRIACLLTVLIIIGFVWFVGVGASILRAAIMGCLSLLAVMLGRQNWSILTYLLTIGIMLLVKPDWIGDLSFQLSALATLGIILFGRARAVTTLPTTATPRLWSVCYSLVADDLRVTLSAQVFTIPLIVFTFHRLSLISPLTNILIGWTMAPITAIGLSAVLLGWIWLPLGTTLAWVCWLLLDYLILAVHMTARLPFSSINF